MSKKCVNCGNEIIGQRRKYCSSRCVKSYQNKKYNSYQKDSAFVDGVSGGSVGAAHEMLVCVDLLRKGFEVFRSVSPHSKCDLIARNNGSQYTIEVRTCATRVDGSLSLSKANMNDHYYDIYAAVTRTGGIHYLDPNEGFSEVEL